MRKTTYAVLLVVLAIGISACKGKTGDASGSTAQTESTAVTQESTEGSETGAVTGEAPGGETSSEGETSSDSVSGGESTSDGTEAAGETDPVLSKIHSDVKEAYGELYIPSVSYDAQMLDDLFGVPADLYDSYVAEGPMISAHVDTFVAVKAKEGKGAEVEKQLAAYREMLLEDTMQYPSNISKIQASEVVRHGDYVFFVMLGAPDPDAEAQGEEAALDSAKANNKIAIDIIDKALK